MTEKTDQKIISEVLSDAAFLDWQKPEWESGGRVHNWHNYAPAALRMIWDTFNLEQKMIVAVALDESAGKEHWD